MALHETSAGSLLLATDFPDAYLPAPTLHTEVVFQISGMIARARITQRFHNPTGQWVEGVYVFPLPETAAVDQMRMKIGERMIEGQIKEREEAKQIFEAAKQEGKKASLLEQERPNIFTTSVANIGPGETIEIEIEYQEDIRYEQGRFHLRFPMVVAPRYIPGLIEVAGFDGTGWGINTTEVPDAERVTPPLDHSEDSLVNPVTIRIELDAGLPLRRVESPSHRLRVVSQELTRRSLTLDNGAVPADRDFVLEWEIEPSAAPRVALFTQMMAEDKYILLMMMPPEGGPGEVGRLPRETLFIIDTSGSMAGASIRQARKALLVALERLRPEDAFNIIEFNNRAHRLFPNSLAAESGHLETAKRHVGALRANGGTEMMSALQLALDGGEIYGGELGQRVRQVIFITDGSVGNERRLFEYIREHLGASRLFTVGIGSAPNSHFMRKAAQFGRGTFTTIGNLAEVEEEMIRLFRKLESPVLRNIRLDWACPDVEAWPERLPDLYQGEPLLVAARLTAFGDDLGAVTLSGSRAEVPWQQDLALKGGAQRIGLDKLWARKKIASLMDRLSDGASEEEVRPAIIELGLRHHLVSKYTSLVAVDVTPTAPVGELPETKPLPVNLPAGWRGKALSSPGDERRSSHSNPGTRSHQSRLADSGDLLSLRHDRSRWAASIRGAGGCYRSSAEGP